MTWVYETIGRAHDVRVVLLAVAVSTMGGCLFQTLLATRSRQAPSARLPLSLLAAFAFGGTDCLAYYLTVLGFSGLDPAGSLIPDAFAATLVISGTLAAIRIGAEPRAGYRDVLLAGAVLACGVACAVFLALTDLTRPFRLAYDLVPVTATVLLSAILGGLGIVQAVRATSLPERLASTAYIGGVQVLLNLAGLCSISSFADFLLESDKPISLATEPVVVVVASCGLVILLLAIAGTAVDHHLTVRAERESERLRQLADSTSEGIVIHRGGVILDVNAAFCALVGKADRDMRGQDLTPLFRWPNHKNPPWEEAALIEGPVCREIELQGCDDLSVPVEVLARTILYMDAIASVLAVRDLRERRLAEQRIRHLANHDALTGLPNRALLGEQARHALQLAQRAGGPAAVLCLDLDRFKAVNDTMGHAAGDMLLRQVAGRLKSVLRVSDIVARIGGDEFVIVQEGACAQPQSAATLAKRIVDELCVPFDLAGKQACIGTSVGVALYPVDGEDVETLFKNADVALYRAKAGGRSMFCLYEAGMDQHMRERQRFEADLRAAIGTPQLAMHYQPLVGCHGEGVCGFEALMRWTHPARGAISPADFIPLAEETGLITVLGRWSLEEACRAAVSWPSDAIVAVNVSPAQFRGDALPGVVAEVLARSGLAPSRLELEVTEGILISDTEHALVLLRRLKDLGIRIALDDFGTGYSSLSYLRRFPFDKLKIDRSFVTSVAEDADARSIVEAILALGQSLHLHVTAEGVETIQQLAVLQERSCNTVQGFLLGKPMASDLVRSFLEETLFPTN